MRELLVQIDAALNANLYYLAMFGTLAVPDICAAMQSEDGRASGQRYADWFDRYVADKYVMRGEAFLIGKDCYHLRCSLLHQGSSHHEKSSYSYYAFVEPNPSNAQVHMNASFLPTGALLQVDLITFCRDMIAGAEAWLSDYQSTDVYQKNYDMFVRRRADGRVRIGDVDVIPVMGLPVIM